MSCPLGGVLADRWNVHRAIVVMQVLGTIQALALAVLAATGVITSWQIVLLSVAAGVINAFDIPLRQTFVVEMVERGPAKRDCTQFLPRQRQLLGPSMAGLIALVGEGICFLINGLSYIPVNPGPAGDDRRALSLSRGERTC